MSGPAQLNHTQLRDWLRLSRTKGVGPVTFANLIKRFGNAKAALDELPRLARRGGRIKALSKSSIAEAEAELDALHEMGGRMLASCEDDYPTQLANIDPPPPVISVLGHFPIFEQRAIAIVGSRNASALGMRFARQIAGDLGAADFTIVSGLARGIDGAAHLGTLDTGSIAVIAGGVDHIYPAQHADLRSHILATGAVVSERRLGHAATARDFPRRNRIISGLALGTIVIEAAKKSGSLITARYALEQNREVFAVPGSPLDPRANGSNGLLRQGAILVECADDVISALNQNQMGKMHEMDHEYDPPAPAPLDEAQIDAAREMVQNLLSPSPVHHDELVRASGHRAAIVAAALVELELAGNAQCLPGGLVSAG